MLGGVRVGALASNDSSTAALDISGIVEVHSRGGYAALVVDLGLLLVPGYRWR